VAPRFFPKFLATGADRICVNALLWPRRRAKNALHYGQFFVMVTGDRPRRHLAFFKCFGVDQPAFCSPLQRFAPNRPTGESRSGRHRVSLRVVVDRPGNLRPPKSACRDPDEKLEAIEALGSCSAETTFDLRTADCRPKGVRNGESNLQNYAPSNAAGRQLHNGISHKEEL